MSLSVNQVLEILRTQEPVSELPFRPKGGEIICFKADGVKSQDWRSDGHRWINQGTVGLPRSNPKVKKKYFYIANESGGASKDFVKFVYHEPDHFNGPFVIQYHGDEEASELFSHGNSKSEKIFMRTKPSSLDSWLQKTKTEDPHVVYKKELTTSSNMTDENNDLLSKPRNLKQLQNARLKVANTSRISHDTLYNMHEIARDTGSDFIHLIQTRPDPLVICGHTKIMTEMENVLCFGSSEQLLSYDPTFQLGDFYVSSLIFKHIIFKETLCLPALFLIHERKFQKHHEEIFQFIRDNIKFSKRSVALVTDGEQGMISAMNMLPSAVDIRCWNHVLQDFQRWLLENGANKAESAVYKDDIRVRKQWKAKYRHGFSDGILFLQC